MSTRIRAKSHALLLFMPLSLRWMSDLGRSHVGHPKMKRNATNRSSYNKDAKKRTTVHLDYGTFINTRSLRLRR